MYRIETHLHTTYISRCGWLGASTASSWPAAASPSAAAHFLSNFSTLV